MEDSQLQGVVVPMVTPLTEAGEIDSDGAARLVDFLIDRGADAIFALGSSGEFVSLTWKRQRRLIECVAHTVNGRIPLCVGVSENCMEEVVARAAEAAELGATHAVVLPPFYFRLSQGELIRFFTELADRIPLPLVMYNMPFRTNNNIEPATVETLAAHPRIVAIKDTVPDMARTLDVLGRVGERDDFAYLHGNELLSLPAALYGAKGMVPAIANFAPAAMASAWAATAAGDSLALQEWQKRIQGWMRVFGLLETRPQDSTTLRLQAIKVALQLLGICGCTMAQLNEQPGEAQIEKVREFLRAEGILNS